MDRFILILMTGILWISGVPQNDYAFDSYHSNIAALVMEGGISVDDATNAYQQARHLIIQQRFSEAIEQLDLVPRGERDLSYFVMASQAYLALQQYENAIEALQLARGYQPNDLNLMYQLARTYRVAGQVDLSTSLAESIISRDRTHRQTLILYGAIKSEQGNWDVSGRVYQELVNQDSTNTTFRYNLATALNQLGDRGQALIHLSQAHRFSPNHHGVLHDLIKINYDLGFFDIAREFAEIAIDRQPNYIPFRKRFAELEFRERNYVAAATHYKQVIELGESTPNSWRNYALSLYFAENYQDAADSFRRALSFGDGDPNAHFYLAMSLHRLGQTEEALRQLDLSIENSMGTLLVDGYVQKGSMLDQSGDATKAYESYRMVLALNPTRIETYFHIAAAYDRTGRNRVEARDYYRQFMHAEGNKDDTMLNYARNRVSRLNEEIHFRGNN